MNVHRHGLGHNTALPSCPLLHINVFWLQQVPNAETDVVQDCAAGNDLHLVFRMPKALSTTYLALER